MDEEKIKPSLKYIQTSFIGATLTFLLLSISSYIGIYLAQVFLRYGTSFFSSNPDSWMGLLVFVGMLLTITFLIHLPIKKALLLSTIISIIIYVYIVVKTFGTPENTMPLMIAAIPFLLAILTFISLSFRFSINKLGVLGHVLCYCVTIFASIILFQ